MERTHGLTGTQLKLIAIVCMTIDHAALLFLPADSALSFLLRSIGRMTAPIMSFLLAEGVRHTHDLWRYLKRMLVFAAIAQPVYFVMIYRRIPETAIEFAGTLDVLFSMTIAIMMIWLVSALRARPRKKWMLYLALVLCFLLTQFTDWKCMIPVWAMIFYFFRERPRARRLLYITATVLLLLIEFLPMYPSFIAFSFQLCTLLALPLLGTYNGQRGGGNGKTARAVSRWTFYVYYPLHITVLVLVRAYLNSN